MDYIIRNNYIKKIEPFVNKPIIKIIIGMRRVGKSTIISTISDVVLKKVPKKNKIYINFEDINFINIRNSLQLMEYIKPLIKGLKGKVYFFFDEIQLVDRWEEVINGLRLNENFDIYITGSNSSLISSDLATHLTGRYVQFEIKPFTFSEFVLMNKHLEEDVYKLFSKYIEIGGMPFLKYFNLESDSSYKYLQDVYNTIVLSDILEYNKIRDVDMFNRIVLFVIQNIGSIFSANSIKRFLKNENRNISVDSILNYLEYCKGAFVFDKVLRHDLKGKKTLKIDEKYYLNDHGFRSAKGFSNTKDIERVLENIVYNELRSRDYKIEIGKNGKQEIDFIARKQNDIKYFQVSYILDKETTRQREFGVYENISDNFDKYVLSMDKIDFSQNGIIHKNIVEWLLEG